MDVTTLALAKAYTDKTMASISGIEGVTEITWDGDTTGREEIGFFYRISPFVPTLKNLIGGSVTNFRDTDGELVTVSYEQITALVGEAVYDAEKGIIIAYNGSIIIALSNSAKWPHQDGILMRKGVWVLGTSLRKLTLGTPIVPVFDLDEHDISIQTLAMQGGGSAEIDASVIFDNIERGKNYWFRGSLGTNTLDILPVFYTYGSDGILDVIGFSFSGNLLGAFVQCNVVLERYHVQVVITPLGT